MKNDFEFVLVTTHLSTYKIKFFWPLFWLYDFIIIYILETDILFDCG